MPAGSDPGAAPALPRTFRPLGVRMAIYVAGVLLLVITAVTWFSFPADIRALFTIGQRATVIGLGMMFYAAGWALARSRVVATTEGLTVVNGFRSRRLAWNQVLAVRLRPGAPWAELDLSDGTSVSAMGVQGSDGDRARKQVREIRALVERFTA